MKFYLAVFATALIFFLMLFAYIGSQAFNISFYTFVIVSRFALGIFIVATVIMWYRRRDGELFGRLDTKLFLISLAFLKLKTDINDDKKLEILKNNFSSYSEKQITKLFYEYKNQDINLKQICSAFRKAETKLRLYIIYQLFNIASSDNILRKEESDFIENTGKFLGIPKKTVEAVKKIYLKKGLTDEEEVKRRQEQQKLNRNLSYLFFPYEAYRILGISPSATRQQIKKAYRTLAKKYHPDKFAGQSEEIIQKAEEKFQEIKEAYDTVLKSKKYK